MRLSKLRMPLAVTLGIGILFWSVGIQGQTRGSGNGGYGQALVVQQGTVINVKMDSTLNSRDSHVGDKFTATVTIPVYVNGRTAIPAGSIVEGRVTQVTPAKRGSKSGTIAVDFDDIIFPNGSRQQLTGSLTAADSADRRRISNEGQVSGDNGKRSIVFIGGGGAVGAVLGGIAGGGTGALLGGVLGAGAGVAAVMLQKGEEAEVRQGTPFGIQLNQDLPVGDENVGEGGRQPDYDPQRDNSTPDARGAQEPPPDSQAPPRGSQAGPPDSSSQAEPPDSSIAQPPRRSGDSAAQPPSQPEPDLPLSSPEMMKRAQEALQDQGYYEGEIDGVASPRTSNALRTYQRDHKLPETGDLDPATAKSLGITGRQQASAAQAQEPPQSSGDYGRQDTQTQTGQQGDSSIAYPRRNSQSSSALPPDYNSGSRQPDSGYSGSNSGYGRRDRRASGDYGTRPGVTYGGTGNGGAADVETGRTLRRQSEDLLAQYQRMIGVQTGGRGVQVERAQYSEPEMSLLFAFNDFANSARLYSDMSASMDPASLHNLVLALAREARRTDRILTTSNIQAAQSLSAKWDAIRQNVLRLMDSQNITAADIEEK